MSQMPPNGKDRKTHLSFRIAELDFCLTTASESASLTLPNVYADFLTQETDGASAGSYDILADTEPLLADPEPSQYLWESLSWRMGLTEDQRISIQLHNVPEDAWVTVANVDKDFGTGTVHPLSRSLKGLSQHALNYPYDQIILINRLLKYDAAILHASGVSVDGHGLLFCGASGVGKTTFARLWRDSGATLLNDEKVIVRLTEDGVILAGTPWHGEDAQTNPGGAPLKGIFCLRQAEENRVERIDGAMAVAKLLATATAPFYSAEGIASAIAIWDKVIRRVPVYVLQFTPGTAALDLCRKTVL